MVYFAKSSSGSTSATLSCGMLEVRPPDCESAGGNLLADGERRDAPDASNAVLDEAKEATDTVDGRRAMH